MFKYSKYCIYLNLHPQRPARANNTNTCSSIDKCVSLSTFKLRTALPNFASVDSFTTCILCIHPNSSSSAVILSAQSHLSILSIVASTQTRLRLLPVPAVLSSLAYVRAFLFQSDEVLRLASWGVPSHEALHDAEAFACMVPPCTDRAAE